MHGLTDIIQSWGQTTEVRSQDRNGILVEVKENFQSMNVWESIVQTLVSGVSR